MRSAPEFRSTSLQEKKVDSSSSSSSSSNHQPDQFNDVASELHDGELDREGDINGETMEDEKHKKHHTELYPLIAGYLGPFSFLLNITPVFEPWLTNTDGQAIEDKSQEMFILLIFSIIASLICNASMFARFLEYKTVYSIYIACIASLFNDIFNISTIILFLTRDTIRPGSIIAEGFWSTVAASVVGLVVTLLLSVDRIANRKRLLDKRCYITHSQRLVLLVTLSCAIWIISGAAVYSAIEGWRFLDSMFFAVVTLATIGFGNLVPTTVAGQIFLFFWATIGILLFAALLTSIRKVIIEEFNNRILARARIRRMKRLRRQLTAKESQMKWSNFWGLKWIRVKKTQIESEPGSPSSAAQETLNVDSTEAREVDIEAKSRDEDSHVEKGNTEMELERDEEKSQGEEAPSLRESDHSSTSDSHPVDKAEWAQLEEIEYSGKVPVAVTIFLIFWLLGTFIFMLTERWGFLEAFYFSYISYTTIGYGDLVVKSIAGKSIFTIYVFIGLPALTLLFSLIGELVWKRLTLYLIKREKRIRDAQQLRQLREAMNNYVEEEVGVTSISLDPDNQEPDIEISSIKTATSSAGPSRPSIDPHLNKLARNLIESAQLFNEHMKHILHANVSELEIETSKSDSGTYNTLDEASGGKSFSKQRSRKSTMGHGLDVVHVVTGREIEWGLLIKYQRLFSTLLKNAEDYLKESSKKTTS
ncbi:uncharacterized protein VTP21DRAFT_9367 [Calcarisporiella thermophila]|uniref:uncharacterized protein n=1 Tax=Calcarisporiella thermophila TaxID=911321 RepID=UPI0037420E46